MAWCCICWVVPSRAQSLIPGRTTEVSKTGVSSKELKSGPRKFSLLLGGGVTVFAGTTDNFLSNGFQPSYYVASFLGYRFGGLRHTVGLSGRIGTLTGSSSRHLSNSFYMPLTASIDEAAASNYYFETGAGVILFDLVRLTAGRSWTIVQLSGKGEERFTLGTATAGLQLRTGQVRWTLDGTVYFNQKLEQFYFRPSAGAAVLFYMIRFY